VAEKNAMTRLVGGAFDWRRGNANDECGVANAGAFRFSGARDHSNVELDAPAVSRISAVLRS